MPNIDIEVYCSCGNGLCNQSQSKGYGQLIIEPCEDCLKKKYNEGYEDGYEQAIFEHDETLHNMGG